MDIYVGNLHYHVDEEYLEEIFSYFGHVERVTLIRNKLTNESKGKAFVRMPNGDEANRAIEGLDGNRVKGRPILVQEAIKKEYEQEMGGGFSGRPSSPTMQPDAVDLIQKLTRENQDLKREVDELKLSQGIVYGGETFLPLDVLKLKDNARTFLETNNVVYVSKESMLQKTELKGYQGIHMKLVSDIRLAISSFFFDNGLKDPNE